MVYKTGLSLGTDSKCFKKGVSKVESFLNSFYKNGTFISSKGYRSMEQTELFYFSKNDLMIRVEYNKLESMASYKCHRKMEAFETALIEKYIEMKILEAPHGIVVYFGEDDELQKTWDEFHSRPEKKGWRPDILEGSVELEDKDKWKEHYKKEIHDKYSDKKKLLSDLQGFLLEGISTKMITDLKEAADEGFCFDKIGDILRDRKENHPEEPMYQMRELIFYLKEYNTLTNNNITIDSLIE